MDRPLLKPFADLRRDDFAAYPIWVHATTNDYDEPWWPEVEATTYRPRSGPLPASPTETGLLVRATATLRDGTPLPGFLTPVVAEPEISEMHPHLFVGEAIVPFWGGSVGIPEATQLALPQWLGRATDRIFPIRFAADPALCLGTVEIVVNGFAAWDTGN